MSKVLFILFFALVFSACSPEALFELVAKSDIEQAASQSVNQSSQVIAVFDKIIEDKKIEYSFFTKLGSVEGDASFGYLFADSVDENKPKTMELYAILPPLESETHFFEAWLAEKNTGKMVSMGRLIFDASSNSRSVVFTATTERSAYDQVIVTSEDGVAPKPGKIILEGTW